MKTCRKRNHQYSDNTPQCPECKKHTTKLWQINNADSCKVYNKKYLKKWQKANRTKTVEYVQKWRKENLELAKRREKLIKKKWLKNNKAISLARTNNKRADKLQRMPKWLSTQQRIEIQDFYVLAKELQWLSEEQLQVDHIIPLKGKHVSGLHVPWNLQILPRSINYQKSNKF